MIKLLTVGFLVAVIIFHVFAIRRHAVATLISKGFASLFFVGIGAWMLYLLQTSLPEIDDINRKLFIFIFIGLVLGFIGDVLLAFRAIFTGKRKQFIAAGMIAFGLGHLAYIIPPIVKLSDPMWIVLPLVLSIIISVGNWKLSSRLGLEYGKFSIPVIVYGAIIMFLLLSTMMNCIFEFVPSVQYGMDKYTMEAWIPMIPIVLFTISDLMLNMNYFSKDQKPMSGAQIIVIHVTYYAAQFLFALGVTLEI